MAAPVCCLILHNYYSIKIRIKQQREKKAISSILIVIYLFGLRSFSSPRIFSIMTIQHGLRLTKWKIQIKENNSDDCQRDPGEKHPQ